MDHGSNRWHGYGAHGRKTLVPWSRTPQWIAVRRVKPRRKQKQGASAVTGLSAASWPLTPRCSSHAISAAILKSAAGKPIVRSGENRCRLKPTGNVLMGSNVFATCRWPCRPFPSARLDFAYRQPANGVVFDRAKLLNGRGVILHRVRSGYKLTLPTEMKWGRVDTVIALNVK